MKKPLFIFIGYTNHYVDSIAPRLGTELKRRYPYCDIIGDLEKNIHAKNSNKYAEILPVVFPKDKYYHIAIDVGFIEGHRSFHVQEGGIYPSLFMGRRLEPLGDVGLIVNISPIYSRDDLLNNKYDKKIRRKTNQVYSRAFNFIEGVVNEYYGGLVN